MTVRATVLCENTVVGIDGSLADQPCSARLETLSGPFLFDTGSGRTLLNNVLLFSTPIHEAQGILLSHHHNGHTGGLPQAVQHLRRGFVAAEAPDYRRPDLFKQGFHERKGVRSFSALPLTRGALEQPGSAPTCPQRGARSLPASSAPGRCRAAPAPSRATSP